MESEVLEQLAMLSLAADEAMDAIDLQAERVRIVPFDAQSQDLRHDVDARFLIVALRWLHRTSRAASVLSDSSSLKIAVDTFEQRISTGPAKDMRDIWEHHDEYVQGRGRLQGRPGDQPSVHRRNLNMWIRTGGANTLGSFNWAGLEIQFDVAVAAAKELHLAVQTAGLTFIPVRTEHGPCCATETFPRFLVERG